MGHNNSQNSDRPPAEPTGNGHYNGNRYGPRGSGRGNTGQTLINTEEDREDVTNSGLREMGRSRPSLLKSEMNGNGRKNDAAGNNQEVGSINSDRGGSAEQVEDTTTRSNREAESREGIIPHRQKSSTNQVQPPGQATDQVVQEEVINGDISEGEQVVGKSPSSNVFEGDTVIKESPQVEDNNPPTRIRVSKQGGINARTSGNMNSGEQEIIGTVPNLNSSGDEHQPRSEGDGTIRLGFQNVNTIKKPRAQHLPEELEVVKNLGIDICGFVETNRPWTTSNKEIYDLNMNALFGGGTNTQYASMRAEYGTTYQPGGVMQTINGHTTGRITNFGVDKYGRYAWHALRGSRDEGVLVITAYRVCQETIGSAGPMTAFMQQYTAMVAEGKARPNPRQQIFIDLLALIQEKRAEGYRPIVMMDANGSTLTDKRFRDFQREACLVDPYYDRFNEMPATYNRGIQRLDYILMDAGLANAVMKIGYLGTHEAVYSDHSMCWVDFDEKLLFRGLINRPATMLTRQFTLHQADKVDAFIKELRAQIDAHGIPRKVVTLLNRFYENGATPELICEYNKLDKEYTDLIRAALNKTGHRRYGYYRSPELTLAGQLVNLHKAILDCLRRKAPPSEGLIKLAALVGYDMSSFGTTAVGQQRKQVREARKALWKVQKECDAKRISWLETEAKARSAVTGVEWEQTRKTMIRTVKEASTNRKLRAITKGRHTGLDRIDIPADEYLYSAKLQELYHYDKGVFEAHSEVRSAETNSSKLFYAHHTLKVPDPEAIPVSVEVQEDGKLRIVNVLPTSTQRWEPVTSQKEIEQKLLWRNHRHLQQVAMEGGPSTQPPIQQLMESGGMSEAATAALEGTYEPMEIDSTLAKWLEQLKRSEKEKEMAPTVGSIPREALQEAFKAAKERTSSNGDLHYTVWKAMVADDDFAEWLSIMISIPFIFGFAPNRWKTMTDVMLEKKKGVRQIHQLRIIGLLEADFNTALKYFARELSRKMEESGELSDEQWGSRHDRTSIDAAIVKLLTFETARAKKSTIGMIYYDCASCFDRMPLALSNLLLRKNRFDEGILLAREDAITGMQRHVRTGLGTSEDFYSEKPGEPSLCGEIQGKADVPSLFTASSSAMLKAHAALAPGLHLKSCTGERSIKRHNVSYVDDNDGNTSAPPDSERPLDEVITRMRLSSTIWNKVVNYTAQSLAYQKCAWQVLAWEVVKGELKIVMAIDDVILLEDHKGASSVIKFMPPDQPNKGLGYHLCPDGNQHHEFKVVMQKLRTVAASTSSSFLTDREAKQLLYQRLMPAIDYHLHLTSFTEKQCDQLNTVVRKHFFPAMHFNRNTANAVMRGPMEQGGMELPDMYTRQDQKQVTYIIKQLRKNGTVANDFLVTLDMIQLLSGLTTPILEFTKKKLRYLDQSFIVRLQERLSEIDASIWIEEAWVPQLQRDRDESLMEAFMERDGITTADYRKLNAVRIYLRVITIADLADESGTFIGCNALQGDWRAQSDFEWPDQPRPPDKWFTLFRRHIRETFCTRLDERHHKSNSMDLDIPLGLWNQVPRNTWFECYRSPNALYRRYTDESGQDRVQLMVERPRRSGHYRHEQDVDTVPLNSYPIKIANEIGEGVWTRRPHIMNPAPANDPKPPGYIVENTHLPTTVMRPSKTGSDGSVHKNENVAAAAWIIPTNEQEFVKACYLMTNVSSVNSYRSELEGVFRSLYHMQYLGMDPEETVTQWFDNESGVQTSNRAPVTGKDMMQPEADLLLAIHHLKSKLAFSAVSRHVRGHQDARTRRKQTEEPDDDSLATTESTRIQTIDCSKFTDEAKLNIACDELAGATAAGAIANPESLPPPTELLQMPYEGSKAVLRIGKKWITSQEHRYLYAARREPHIRKYIMERHNWNEEQYNSVHWRVIGAVRRRSNTNLQRFTGKLMHGILPVNHVRRHVIHTTQCPGCACPDETIAHIFQCSNPMMVSKREEIIAALRKKGLRKLSRKILHTIADFIQQYSEGGEMRPTTTNHPAILAAVKAQSELGWDDFFRGYLVKDWLKALEATKNADAHQQFDQLQQLIWFDVALPQWTMRNQVAHGPDSNTIRVENAHLASQLEWYNAHRHEILPAHQQELAKHNSDDIMRMKLSTRRAWLRHLEIAIEDWEKRRYHREAKQQTLDGYIATATTETKPKIRDVVHEARTQASGVILIRESRQPEIDKIFKKVKEQSKT